MSANDEIVLPSIIIDPHCHGRDMQQAHKTTVKQTLREAKNGLITISVFMPNTVPSVTTIEAEEKYHTILDEAEKKLALPPQYLWFGVTDDNLSECYRALARKEVVGIKVYPKDAAGRSVTTGTIGLSIYSSIFNTMLCARLANKPVAVHCDDPYVIAKEGNTVRAEADYVALIIRIARIVPGVRIVFCHVSCCESAKLIIAAQKSGLDAIIELSPHHLWFDNEGTNWNPRLDPVFYHCYNNLRPGRQREFLITLLKSDLPVYIGSDTAAHTREEKLANPKLGGIPSNQEMVAVICTLAKNYEIPNGRVADLLTFNAARFLNIDLHDVAYRRYRLVSRKVTATYNNDVVENPWQGSELLFPEPY